VAQGRSRSRLCRRSRPRLHRRRLRWRSLATTEPPSPHTCVARGAPPLVAASSALPAAVDVEADEGEVVVVDAADGVYLGLELVLIRLAAAPGSSSSSSMPR
jgi:hypothetical protein